jgi:hypothetical protein
MKNPKPVTSEDLLLKLGVVTPKRSSSKKRAQPFIDQKQKQYPSRKPGVNRGFAKKKASKKLV